MKTRERHGGRLRSSFLVAMLAGVAAGLFLIGENAHAQDTSPTPAAAVRKRIQPAVKSRVEGASSYSHGSYAEKLKGQKETPEHETAVHLTPEMIKVTDVRTAPAIYRNLVRQIQTVGEITYDERRVKVVSAWIGGRIDRLYVDFTGVRVKRGQRLAEIYSPELVSTQQEFLLALETRARLWSLGNQEALRAATDLVEATRKRLLLWGISKEQVDRLERTREANTHMTLHAPIGGTVIDKQAYEGQYVKTGERLYTIADLSVVWAVANVYEYEMGWVAPGQKVSITTPAYPGKTFTGRVSFIDPFLDTKTRSVKVRMDVPNAKLTLKPGMFVDARLKIVPKRQRPVLAIPFTAVLDTGVRKLAYVDLGGGMFKPVEIRVGQRAGQWVPVLAGLREGDRVAVSANYLMDSQRALGGASGSGFGGDVGGGHGGH